MYYSSGDYNNAMSCYEEQKKTCLELGDKKGYSAAVGNMGNVYIILEDRNRAMQYYEEQKQISLEMGDKNSYSLVLGNIGTICCLQGDYVKAMRYYEEQKKDCLEIGDRRGYVSVIGNIGNVLYDLGEYGQALKCYEEKKDISLELGIKSGFAIAVGCMAVVYRDLGEYDKAVEYFEEAVKTDKILQNKYLYCVHSYDGAELMFSLKDYEKSRQLNDEANQIASEFRIKEIIFKSNMLASRLMAVDKPEEALAELTGMLEEEREEENVALMHYEIYRINNDNASRQKAIEIYSRLFAKTPKYDYKKKIEEMSRTAEE